MTRIERILSKMVEKGLDYLLITDPHAIKYIIGYDNDPHERMYMMILSTKGNHQLFFNQLFYVDRDLGLPITWFDDGTDALALIADYIKDGQRIGVDKFIQARWLLPLINSVKAEFVLGSSCVDEVRAVKDEEEQAIMIRASEINDAAMGEIKKLLATDKTEAEMGDELLKVYRSLDAIDH
ncbi:MAG: aminopeptidase P family N-terminal domain-containing protein, partial [Erysipelotrichaceae bacterium]|nr:aminopeptidase P family N-terminal domain-containing protein [Erysipelotrichaceae bacterium]